MDYLSCRRFEFSDRTKDFSLPESDIVGGEPTNITVDQVLVLASEVLDPHFSSYTWPCSAVMAQFIWHHRANIRSQTILEVSAGTCVPGILAAKLGNKVILSEYPLRSECLARCRQSGEINKVAVNVVGIIWGQVTQDLLLLPSLDLIFLSDVFYEERDCEDILFTISFLLQRHPQAKCYCTYQVRDENWSILALLQKWRLRVKNHDLASFQADCANIADSGLPGSVDVQLIEFFYSGDA